MKIRDYCLLFILGGLGGLCRYGLGLALPHLVSLLAINLLGTFILIFCFKGWLNHKRANPNLILALGTGFAGGFTSFSSLILDLVKLTEGGQVPLAIVYLFAHLIGGLLVANLAQAWAERLGWT